MIYSHLRDAYALNKFFAEIENDIVANGATDWTELKASARSLMRKKYFSESLAKK